jgi:hypothetical protein
MDTKSSAGPSRPFDNDIDAEAPPAYSDTISSFTITNANSSPSSYYSSQISFQLRTLTSQISSLETQKVLFNHAQEENILAILTTHIQTYLSDFATTGLSKGTLILVPANGLQSPDARPTDSYFRDPNDYDRMVKVRGKDDGAEDGSWYWHDENMAERLARCLKPVQDPRTRELPPRKEEIRVQEKKKEEGRGFWGWKKGAVKARLVEERRVEKSMDSKGGDGERESSDKVVFDVKAEEISFRSENSLGLYEMEKGFGIVLRLRVVFCRK